MPKINKIYTSKDKRLWIVKKCNEFTVDNCDIFKILNNQNSFHCCKDVKEHLFPNDYPECDCTNCVVIVKLNGGI